MKPLDGLKVIDLTFSYSGPFCTMQLADFGAEVIKIENRDGGDQSRTYFPIKNGYSGFFATYNRGKKSITLDLNKENGKKILKDLVRDADVLVENYKPNTMDKLELGYDELIKINPELIYASISGFGLNGPYKDFSCSDNIAQSVSGIMETTGFPNGQPTKVGVAIGDSLSGLKLCLGILFAYYNKIKTGEGQRVDVAKLDALFAINEPTILYYTALNEECTRAGNSDPTIAPYDVFETKDGFMSIGVASESIWPKFCKAVGMEELIEDDRFTTKRLENYSMLRPIIEKYTKKRTKEELEKKLLANKVPFGPVLSVAEVMEHPQIKARNMVVEINDPVIGKFKIPGIPIKLEKSPGIIDKPAPTLGQDTNSILKSIGYSEEEISKLKNERII